MEFPFFHGNITKSACEELLSKKGKNGSYLIRESESVEGALCLCVFSTKLSIGNALKNSKKAQAADVDISSKKSTINLVQNQMDLYSSVQKVTSALASFEKLIYTYRIFREHQGYFRIQTCEGAPEKVFRTLKDLIYNFEKPNQGLVTNLRYPVKKPKASQRNQRFKSGEDSVYDEIDESDYINVLP